MKTKFLLALLSVSLAGASAAAQEKTAIAGFADVRFSASDKSGENSSFGIGQYDTYVTSQISDRVSFLGEVVFEYDEGWIVDVERVTFKYNATNYLNLIAGKQHTPIGYWNTAFHHGSVIQPTIQRPLSFLFEDEGGILPIHSTGFMISGSNIGKARFGYDLMVANGIGSTPTADDNADKSYTLALHFEPLQSLTLGGSFYYDKVSKGTVSLQGAALTEKMDQKLINGMLTYLPFSNSLEFIAEIISVSNSFSTLPTTRTTTYYGYAGYGIGAFTPYARYEEMVFELGETYYVKNDMTQLIVGLRYDLNYLTTLKIEFNRTNSEFDGKSNKFESQFAIGF